MNLVTTAVFMRVLRTMDTFVKGMHFLVFSENLRLR
jgi:hypothetical protein